ncbi:MAG: M1 family aminopeptidase [Gemmatimonadaceae bacterium]
MSRFLVVARDEFAMNMRRPLTWITLILVGLIIWGISSGNVSIVIGSGDASVGGKKALLTSEFAVSQIFAAVSYLFYLFTVSAAAGLTIIRDAEAGALELLNATPLTPREYAWGKLGGVFASYLAILLLQLLVAIFFLQLVPNAEMLETRGAFALGNYLRPTLLFGVPMVIFAAGVAFGIGTATRRSILVFVLPVGLIVLSAFFLWSWTPTWLPDVWNKTLMAVDPAGVRWLRETWLKVDRGADFYNTQHLGLDAVIIANRLVMVGLGILSAWLGVRSFARTARVSHRVTAVEVNVALAAAPVVAPVPAARATTVSARVASPRGWWASAVLVAKAEARELRSQAGLYLFVPMILLQILGNSLSALGAFDTPLLLVPGDLAVSQMQAIGTLVALLLVFYGVESLERERATRLNNIQDSMPLSNGAIVTGKVLALGVVLVVILAACLVASIIAILVQGKVHISLVPFLLVWGFILLPTYLVWTSLVFAAYALTRNRYTTYAVALAVMGGTFYLLVVDKLTWLTNWPLWGLRWSDMSLFEFDRTALILNRLGMLALAALLARIAVLNYPRIDRDATRQVHALAPREIYGAFRRSWAFVLVPALLFALLARQVSDGPDGARARKVATDYWKKNLATWKDAPTPWLKDADLDITLNPAGRAWTVKGSYLVVNQLQQPLREIPVTVGMWQDMHFTLNGAAVSPDTASHLYVFTPARPLAPGDSVRVGFSYRGVETGARKAVGGAGTFIVPSGVVMTNFDPRYFPFVGYVEGIGAEKERAYEPKQYGPDWYEGETPSAFGGQRPMTVRMRITTPKDMMANGVGERVRDEVHGDTRTVEWRTDHPVMAFNVVAGRYEVKTGPGTALYYHAAHSYNVDEMIDAMNQVRRYYSDWFGPFPWKELKISEFPALATYAQGFPTNISFSESIGFLTKSEPKTNLAFLVVAHESAHQWWGNMVQPGIGPSGNFLSEGMAHFSTALLIEQVKGERNALEFRKRIESLYGDQRRSDAERKMFRVDGSKDGDNTVWYNKGGWVFWMLADRMGRPNALRGMRDFVAAYQGNPDHPVLYDFAHFLRGYAPDTVAYDDFIRQWMDSVVVPEYRVRDVTSVHGTGADTSWLTTATVENVGTGRMPVDVAVTRGERFPDDTLKAKRSKEAPYAAAIISVVLDAKQSHTLTIHSPFKPDKVVVDPNVRVLQLRRQSAEAKVK